MKSGIEIKNKRASFDYEWLDRYMAGICLTGTEIKSIRAGKANINDAYCVFERGELFVRNMNISEYEWGSYNNHDPRQDRKLLLNKKELLRLEKASKDKGKTIIAIKLFINEKNRAKLDIALARGKKEYDKREDIKDRESKRELARLKMK
jgi:SsrA-binding protein